MMREGDEREGKGECWKTRSQTHKVDWCCHVHMDPDPLKVKPKMRADEEAST